LTADDAPVEAPAPKKKMSWWKVGLRVLLVVGVLAVSAWVLLKAFDDLDFDAVFDALKSLDDAEILALIAMWILWVASQGLLTASLITQLPVRRGVLAFLGPAAVGALVPGPSDLPVRYRMLTSWGRAPSEATVAVAAGGLFSIGIKLLLPVIAAVGLLVTGAELGGALKTVVIVVLAIGGGAFVLALILGSRRATERFGRLLDPVWRALLRLMRKPDREDLGTRLLASRESALARLKDRWLLAAWGTLLTAGTKFALLLMAIRFTGVPDDVLPWTQVFVAYALVSGLTVVPITAGDAGVSDVAFIAMLTASAGDEHVNTITAGVILYRVITWLLVIPVGLGALGVWQRGVRREAAAAAPA